MTRVTTQINMNMTMHRRTDSIGLVRFLTAALMLVFGFRGPLSGTVDVESLYAAETVTVSGHSLMKKDTQPSNRTEGLATIAAAEPILSRK